MKIADKMRIDDKWNKIDDKLKKIDDKPKKIYDKIPHTKKRRQAHPALAFFTFTPKKSLPKPLQYNATFPNATPQ